MRRIVCFSLSVLLICLAAGNVRAQDVSLLKRFYGEISDSCTEIVYSYDTRISGIRTVGEGTLLVQGKCWHMEGNGVVMWCDSVNLWIADPELKEVVIESASEDYGETSNPAILFVRLEDMFDVREALPSSDGSSIVYVLVPDSPGKIEYCNLEISKSDASIRKGEFIMSDGNLITVNVSEMKILPKRGVESFRPSGEFDSSWIVTDMR